MRVILLLLSLTIICSPLTVEGSALVPLANTTLSFPLSGSIEFTRGINDILVQVEGKDSEGTHFYKQGFNYFNEGHLVAHQKELFRLREIEQEQEQTEDLLLTNEEKIEVKSKLIEEVFNEIKLLKKQLARISTVEKEGQKGLTQPILYKISVAKRVIEEEKNEISRIKKERKLIDDKLKHLEQGAKLTREKIQKLSEWKGKVLLSHITLQDLSKNQVYHFAYRYNSKEELSKEYLFKSQFSSSFSTVIKRNQFGQPLNIQSRYSNWLYIIQDQRVLFSYTENENTPGKLRRKMINDYWDRPLRWYEYNYLTAGTLDEVTTVLSDGSIEAVAKYKHDEKGRCIQIEKRDNQGQLRSRNTYEYVKESFLLKKEVRFDSQNQQIQEIQYHYLDEDSSCITQVDAFNSNHELVGHIKLTYKKKHVMSVLYDFKEQKLLIELLASHLYLPGQNSTNLRP